MYKEQKGPKWSVKQDCPPRPFWLLSQTSKFRKHMGVGIFGVIDHRHDIALVTKTVCLAGYGKEAWIEYH